MNFRAKRRCIYGLRAPSSLARQAKVVCNRAPQANEYPWAIGYGHIQSCATG